MDLGVLESAAADVPARHRSMRSVLDWSWSLLTRDAQHVLASCSVFRGRFDLDAVDTVAAGPSLAAIDELVAHSLVTSGHRFGLHELVRSYAGNRLAENPSLESATRGRHARHFAHRLQTGWDMEDFEDLRSATGWLIEHDDADSLGDHLQRLWVAYRSIGAYAEARDVFEGALERADASQLNRSRWHECAGQAHLQMGRLAESHDHLADSLRSLGAPFPRNRSAIMLKLSSQIARQLAHRVLPWATRSGDARRREAAIARAERLNLIGETFYLSGDPMPVGVAAIWALNESEVAGESELARIGRAETALMWGAIGRHRAARRYAEEATRGETSDLDQERLAFCYMVTMVTWLGLGEWARVESNGARALEGASRSPNLRMHEQADLLIAVADNLRGRFVEAHDRGQEVVANARRRGSLETQMWGHLVLAEAACRLDRLESARVSGLKAVDFVAQTHDRGGDRARAESILARVALARGHHEEAVGRLLAIDSIMGGKPVFYPWVMEAHTAPMEIALDLIETGYLARAAAGPLLKRYGALASAYARVFPIARPRVALLEGRVAALDGQRRRAHRVWQKGLRLARSLEADWDAAQIERSLKGESVANVVADAGQ
jgi:tetratricopeptide (TPR) repeat protein